MKPEDVLDAVLVPAALENRVRATVAARRGRRYALALAVAAAALLSAVAFWPDAPAPGPPPVPVAFAVSLAGPAPEPMPIQETLFTAELDVDRNVLIFYLGE